MVVNRYGCSLFALSGTAENRDIVARNNPVLRRKGQGFDARLRNQHPVEWIVMVAWQAAGRDGVGGQDRQRVETHSKHDVIKTIEREF